jgi:uncharacterized membrane protein (Fun14 family)
VSDIFTNILFPIGIGGTSGFLVGYATKKIVKLLMVLLGLFTLSLLYLMHKEVIQINSERLLETISSIVAQIADFLLSTIDYLPLSGSFLAGLVLGLAKG